MSILTKAKKLSTVALKPHIITCKAKYLFIFSHMRSRSSVLSHILGSNHSICGYSELHSSYLSQIDLLEMRIKLYQDLKCNLKDKYLLDKFLHNSLVVSKKIFEIAKPKVIFLLRNAESTLKSIINMGNITGIEWYKAPEKVLNYYCTRLLCLEEYAEVIGGGYFFLGSNDLVNNTDYVLESLSRWLKLNEPLDKNYSFFNHTGKAGHGDPSRNIKSGIITISKGYPDIKVPLEILQRGESAYEKCKDNLLKNITTP